VWTDENIVKILITQYYWIGRALCVSIEFSKRARCAFRITRRRVFDNRDFTSERGNNPIAYSGCAIYNRLIGRLFFYSTQNRDNPKLSLVFTRPTIGIYYYSYYIFVSTAMLSVEDSLFSLQRR